MFESEGNTGNNILPRIPQIQKVFDHPVLKGALTSLLGEGYIMNPHRHCHLNPPEGKGQHWHKDCYVFDHNMRHPRFQWVLALYYPQDTTEDMGPTGLLPGKQFYKKLAMPIRNWRPSLHRPYAAKLAPFRSFTLTRGTGQRRILARKNATCSSFSLRVCRHRKGLHGITNVGSGKAMRTMKIEPTSVDVWNWLCGNHSPSEPDTPGDTASTLVGALGDKSVTVRLNAAYTLGRMGASIVPALIDAMRKETLASIEETTAKPPDNLHGTNPTAGYAAQALAAIGSQAVPALVETLEDEHWWVRAMTTDVLTKIGQSAGDAVPALMKRVNDEHWWVRRNAIEALGTIGSYSSDTTPLLVDAVRDEDYRVRRNAALTLAKLGQPADEAIPGLVEMFEDENRYNRFYAANALRRIDTSAARDALMNALFTARWCSITTKDNQY